MVKIYKFGNMAPSIITRKLRTYLDTHIYHNHIIYLYECNNKYSVKNNNKSLHIISYHIACLNMIWWRLIY